MVPITMLAVRLIYCCANDLRLLVLPNTAGKKGAIWLQHLLCFLCHASNPYPHPCLFLLYLWFDVH